MKKKSRDEFIEKARQIHGDKYDYSKVEYLNNRTKVCIICPKHGEFLQTPDNHLHGYGCYKCGYEIQAQKKRVGDLTEFIEKARQIYGDKYDYSKVEYIDRQTKVCIICPTHGEFWQIPYSHLKGYGCYRCSNDLNTKKQIKTLANFIRQAKEIHGNKYEYTKVDYTNARTKVCIICHKHGEFWQTPDKHLRGNGCPYCNQSHLEKDIQKCLEQHNIDFEYNRYYNFLNRLQLDFYIPSKNIAIECQGIQHFEPISFGGQKTEEQILSDFEKLKARDKLKQDLCEQKSIKLLYYSNLGNNYTYPYKVFEDKNDLIKEILN